MAQALARPPCLLSFSGGRDSSALLAVAVQVARREGLELPVPATLVFPGSRGADEDEWQRIVLEHLGVDEQLRIEVRGELDAVGPVATAALRSHGLLWPCNTHFHVPIIERAAGGSVVTGFGGDEIALSSATARAERALTRWRRPSMGELLGVGLALSPRAVRRSVYGRRARTKVGKLPWLTTEGKRRLVRAMAKDQAALPLGWESVVRQRIWRDRYFRICQASFSALGDYYGTQVVHPFVDGRVLDALASDGGFRGLGRRSELMAALFGDLLPEQLVRRSTKGSFTDPLWTAAALQFVREWSGEGVDEELVDPEALRHHWLGGSPNVISTTMLQQAWLHDHRHDG